MWFLWTLLVVCAHARAELGNSTALPGPAASPAPAPARTLDRQSSELAWRSWLQSPESGNPNAPPRRITTKSLFITPLVCPKGQRLDRNGCVQVLTVNKDEHERILLEQLNALFTAPPSGDVVYDYGDDEPGPLQLSIPIGLDPQAAPLLAPEPNAQAQQSDIKVDKKDEIKVNTDATSIEAELELLKLKNPQITQNDTSLDVKTNINNVLSNYLPSQDKPKRDSSDPNETTTETIQETTDAGQKEQVYGNVNIDSVVIGTGYENQQSINITVTFATTNTTNESLASQHLQDNATVNSIIQEHSNNSSVNSTRNLASNSSDTKLHPDIAMVKKDEIENKLNPETDYSDIGEAIKLISRYADVTTDDNFDKDQRKIMPDEDSFLGTRTKLQHRRKIPKTADLLKKPIPMSSEDSEKSQKVKINTFDPYYRYSPDQQHTPPPDYPFHHLQDYWPDRKQTGGLYNTAHENPTRHHHEYPNYYRPRGYSNPYYDHPYPGYQSQHRQPQAYHYGMPEHRSLSTRPQKNDQDLYSLLGLRHWFSGEGSSDR